MATDPGELVLDPTCGSGTTAYVAEQWGRRWITIDTSRVALALARARIMEARYPYYLLADSPEGQRKESEITRTAPSSAPTYGRIRQGFVYERVPHITLKSIADNAEIDVLWEKHQETLEPLRTELNTALDRSWEEWEVPREAGDPWPESAAAAWNRLEAGGPEEEQAAALLVPNRELGRSYTLDDVPDQPRDPWAPEVTDLHRRWWEARIARQPARAISSLSSASPISTFSKGTATGSRSGSTAWTRSIQAPARSAPTVRRASPAVVIDTDYNDESFFVRHAYFLGASDPYKSLKTTLEAEIDPDAWATLHSDISRPFPKPQSGRIAVKVINHLGDEVMKVFRA